MGDRGRIPGRADHWQPITNTYWPQHNLTNLRDSHWEVIARVVFETDGECHLEGTVTRWNKDTAYVKINDRRVSNKAVWLPVADIRRT